MRRRAPSEVRLSTSRTETARRPLARPQPVSVQCNPIEAYLDSHVGVPQRPPLNPLFPGITLDLPFVDVAIQFQMLLASAEAMAFLTLDLGENQDLARIELYGNPLLCPISNGEPPVQNFGLPRRLHILISEEDFTQSDLHRRDERGNFYGSDLTGFRIIWSSNDFRGLWGWNSLHLKAAFGRYLTFVFAEPPPMTFGHGQQGWGFDVQRIVLFNYLEDVDHRPHVEHSPVSVRVAGYDLPSDYWTQANEAAPDPATHQAVFYDPSRDALPLPCALSGLIPYSQNSGELAPLFVSHPVPVAAGGDNRIYLVTEATTDHEPLLEGVRLTGIVPDIKGHYLGPKTDAAPGFRVRVHVTSDREAAYSSDPGHRSWRLVARDRLIRPRSPPVAIRFAEPVVARWVRLTVRPVAEDDEEADPNAPAMFQLHRLDLLRCESWQWAPRPDEDIVVDSAFIRLRGPRILDDYAYIEGRSGFGIAVEVRGEDGVWTQVREFRNLLEVIEETHYRLFSNHRRIDKPVQLVRETTQSTSSSRSRQVLRSRGRSTTTVDPAFGNRQVTRTGSLTDYVSNPHDNLTAPAFDGLPDIATTGVVTTRTFAGDLSDIDPPDIDLLNPDPAALFSAITSWASDAAGEGLPVSIGIGGNLGASGGIAALGTASLSGGISMNAGTQIGGGVTRAVSTGNQGSIVRAESHVESSFQQQDHRGRTFNRSTQSSEAQDEREIRRVDLSEEVRTPGTEVRYGGAYEDLLLITVPVGQTLRGGFAAPAEDWGMLAAPQLGAAAGYPALPQVSREAVRVRVDYLPPGLRMDVQFRGRSVPRAELTEG